MRVVVRNTVQKVIVRSPGPQGASGTGGAGTVTGTVGNLLKIGTGGSIADATVAAGAFLLKASNLSDLANAITARTNLGLGSAAVLNTGTNSGNIPVYGAGGRFSASGTTFQVDALGNVQATSFAGDGSQLTGLTENHVVGLVSDLALKAPLASAALTGTPTAPTAAAATNTTQLATCAFVRSEVTALVDSAPGTLDTLGELAAALQADESAATTLTTLVGTKLAKASNLSDLANTTTARTNLGLGTVATLNTGTNSGNIPIYGTGGRFLASGGAFQVDPTGATQATSFAGDGSLLTALNATNLTSGTVATARLGSGTANSTAFLSGANSWIQYGTAALVNTGTGAGNVPVLGGTGQLANSVLPPLAISQPFAVASQAAMLALVAQRGDVAIRSDLNKSFILSSDNSNTLGDWLELLTPTDTVLSVNGAVGVVTFGYVSSVGMTVPSILSVSGTPITSTGTLDVTLAAQPASTMFAGPSSGADAAPTFRTIVPLDLGTGTADATTVLYGDGTWGAPTGGTGTVTDINITDGSGILAFGGGPVTTSGSISIGFIAADANKFLAGPFSGSPDVPTFRTMTMSDLPLAIDVNQRLTSGVVDGGIISGGTYAADPTLGNEFRITISANVTLVNPSSPVDGQGIVYRIKQDGTGGRTISLDTKFRLPSGYSLPTGLTANKTVYLACEYFATDDKWDVFPIHDGEY